MKKLFAVLGAFVVVLGAFAYAFYYVAERGSEAAARTTKATIDAEAPERLLALSSPWLRVALVFAALVLLAEFLRRAYQRFKSGEEKENPLRLPIACYVAGVFCVAFALTIPAIWNTAYLTLIDPSGICQTILSVMALGLCVQIFQLLALRGEWARFSRIRGMVLSIGVSGEERFLKTEKIMGQLARGVFRRKWENFRRSAEFANDADFDTLNAVPNQGETLREAKVTFVIKILPMLGLLGTVAGFVIAVVSMQAAAAGMNDFNSFKGNMITALGGMSTAFLTTLAGIICMIAVMFINTLLSEARARILMAQDEFLYIHVFLPWRHLLITRSEAKKKKPE